MTMSSASGDNQADASASSPVFLANSDYWIWRVEALD
jgi:hypothetical protein